MRDKLTVEVSLMIFLLEAIGECDGVPSGHLYAALMTHNLSLSAYQSRIDMLKKMAAIDESGHFLTKGKEYGKALTYFKQLLNELEGDKNVSTN